MEMPIDHYTPLDTDVYVDIAFLYHQDSDVTPR